MLDWATPPWAVMLLAWVVKGTVVLVVAAAAAWLLRRRSAALRHAVWASALCALLIAPLLGALLPAWHVMPYRAAVARAGGEQRIAQPEPAVARRFTITKMAGTPADVGRTPDVPRSRAVASSATLAPVPILLGLWLVVSLALLTRRGAQQLAAWIFTRHARALERTERAMLSAAAGQRLALSDQLTSPVVFGLFRPRVVLPVGFFGWSQAERVAALSHELAHVRRRDAAWQLLADVVVAVLFFHPLAWLARREICHLAELAADDAALAHEASEIDGPAYAQVLLTLRRRAGAPARVLPSAIVAMARPRNLKQRIVRALDVSAPRGLRWSGALALALFAVIVAAGLGCVAPTTAPSPQSSELAALQLQNNSAEALDLVWIDFEGNERHYETIAPGAKAFQWTFAGHVWLLRQRGGSSELLRLAAAAGTTRLRILADLAVRQEVITPPPAPFRGRTPLRSTTEGGRTEVRFWNLSPRAFDLTWVDAQGKAHPRGRLAADAGYLVQRSTVGHLFQLLDVERGVVWHSERAADVPIMLVVNREGRLQRFFDVPPFAPRDGVVRSLTASTPVTLRVANHSATPLRLVWVTYRGGERDYGAVQAHSGRDMATYVTHPWRLYRGAEKIAEVVMGKRNQALRVDPDGKVGIAELDDPPPRTKSQAPVLYEVGHRAFPAPYGHGMALRFTRPALPTLVSYEVQFSTDGGHSWQVYTRERKAWRDWINHHGNERCGVRGRWTKDSARIEARRDGFSATRCLPAGMTFTYRVRGLDRAKAAVTGWSNVLSASMPDWRRSELLDGWQHNQQRTLNVDGPRSAATPTAQGAELVAINGSSRQAFLFWLDEDGLERFYRRLAPGESWRQVTREGHAWRLRREDGRASTLRITATRQTQRVD